MGSWPPHALAMLLHRDKEWVSDVQDDYEGGVRLILGNIAPFGAVYVLIDDDATAAEARAQRHSAWLLIPKPPRGHLFVTVEPERALGPEWRP